MNKNLINILVLQTGWWITTLFYANMFIFLSACFILLIIHFFYCSINIKQEFLFIAIATTIGCLTDALAIKIGLYSPVKSYSIFPLWLISYWLVFSTSFSMSLAWLNKRYVLIAILGLIMAPLTYFAGEKFNILLFNKTMGFTAYIYYGVLWALCYPLLFKIHSAVYK